MVVTHVVNESQLNISLVVKVPDCEWIFDHTCPRVIEGWGWGIGSYGI